jgi:tripartite-type tricarboxylate transporter receptor subunit TctC
MMQSAAGFKLRHIPYRGASQALVDLLGGRIDVYMSTIPAALAQIKGGQLRALAVTSSARVAGLPEVPTIAESGYPGFEAASWYGLLAPAGVPDPILRQLNREALEALGSDGVREKFATEGLVPLGGSPESFADFLKRELARWGEVVKSSGARID